MTGPSDGALADPRFDLIEWVHQLQHDLNAADTACRELREDRRLLRAALTTAEAELTACRAALQRQIKGEYAEGSTREMGAPPQRQDAIRYTSGLNMAGIGGLGTTEAAGPNSGDLTEILQAIWRGLSHESQAQRRKELQDFVMLMWDRFYEREAAHAEQLANWQEKLANVHADAEAALIAQTNQLQNEVITLRGENARLLGILACIGAQTSKPSR